MPFFRNIRDPKTLAGCGVRIIAVALLALGLVQGLWYLANGHLINFAWSLCVFCVVAVGLSIFVGLPPSEQPASGQK